MYFKLFIRTLWSYSGSPAQSREMKSSVFIGLLFGALLAAVTTYKGMMTTLFIGCKQKKGPIKAKEKLASRNLETEIYSVFHRFRQAKFVNIVWF